MMRMKGEITDFESPRKNNISRLQSMAQSHDLISQGPKKLGVVTTKLKRYRVQRPPSSINYDDVDDK